METILANIDSIIVVGLIGGTVIALFLLLFGLLAGAVGASTSSLLDPDKEEEDSR